ELAGVGGIALDGTHQHRQLVEIKVVDRLFAALDDHHALADVVEKAAYHLAGLAVAAQEVERLSHAVDGVRRAASRQGAQEDAVLEQRDHGPDGVQPGKHRGVDAEQRPQPLGAVERVGDLAEADGRSHEADEVEGVEEVHPPAAAVLERARYDHEADDGHGVGADQDDQRNPQPAQRVKYRAGQRGPGPGGHQRRATNVSMIRSTTETKLASSAPPLSETMEAVTPGDSGASIPWVTTAHTTAAAMS